MKLLASVAMYVIGSICVAQHATSFGVKFSYNHTDGRIEVDHEELEDNGQNGFSLGVYKDFRLSNKLELESGLFFDQYKIQYPTASRFFQGEATDKLSYVGFPLYVQYNLVKHLNINSGPHLNFLLDALSTINDVQIDRKTYTLGYMVSWTVGIEYDVTNYMEVGVKHHRGLNDIDKSHFETRGPLNGSTNYRLDFYQIYMGVSF